MSTTDPSGDTERRPGTNGTSLMTESEQRSYSVGRREQHAQPLRGKMLWFNEEKNRGVISMDAERLPVDGGAFEVAPPQGSCSGLIVEFHLETGEEGPRAARVRLIEDAVPRRARRRHSH
jgi:cold shock CspA family protein